MGIVGAHRYMGEKNVPEVPDRYNLAAQTDKDGGGGKGPECSKFNQAERCTHTYTVQIGVQTDRQEHG